MIFDLNYRRMITQSRWPKFMSWKHPLILKNCVVVFYLDASARPMMMDFGNFLLNLEVDVLRSEEKFAIARHPYSRTITTEFKSILRNRRDIQRNVDASMRWLKDQNDFVDQWKMF